MRGASGSSGARNFFVFPRYGSGILHAPQASLLSCDAQLHPKLENILWAHKFVVYRLWVPACNMQNAGFRLKHRCVLYRDAGNACLYFKESMPICRQCRGLRSPVRLSEVCESAVIRILLWIYRASFNLQHVRG